MPKLLHEAEATIDLSRRGDEIRDLFTRLMGGDVGRQEEFGDPILQQLMGILGGGGADLDTYLRSAQAYGEGASGQFAHLINTLLPQLTSRMRAGAIEGVPGRFETARTNLKTSLARRGLFGAQNPASGLTADPLARLTSEMERERAGALRDVEQFGFNAEAGLRQNAAQTQLQIANLMSGLGGMTQQRMRDLLAGGTGVLNALPDPARFQGGVLGGGELFGQGVGLRANLAANRPPGFWSKFWPTLVGSAAGGFGETFGKKGGEKSAGAIFGG